MEERKHCTSPRAHVVHRRRFQAQSFGDVETTEFADDSKDSYGGGRYGGGRDGNGDNTVDNAKPVTRHGGGSSGEVTQERFAMFSKIVREYVVDGAPNEINIRYPYVLHSSFRGRTLPCVPSLAEILILNAPGPDVSRTEGRRGINDPHLAPVE